LRILCNTEGYPKIDPPKKRAGAEDLRASSVGFVPYVNLVPIVVMMPVVAVIAVSVVPVVCRSRIVAVVGSVIAIWIIAAVWIVAIPITRITPSDSDSSDANRNLSV
jgi:hypothetical protein